VLRGPLVPAVPSCILDPLREEFLALLPPRVDRHPLGCHRRRIDDRIVFDKIVAALVFGCGYERLGDATCSATTLRRRRDEWIAAGIFDALRSSVLAAYERLIGLDLADVAIDGCLTKAPSGGECAGKSPVDRAKGGLKRSQLVDGAGVPITAVPAPANIRDNTLLPATLDLLTGLLEQVGAVPAQTTVHLDAGYDYRPCRAEPAERGLGATISRRGTPAPVQVGKRWVVERTNSWLNDFGRIRRCTERRRTCVEAYLALTAAIVVLRALLRAAWYRYRWDTRPRSPRIR
jgi:transposase